jgi:hypothetical protein
MGHVNQSAHAASRELYRYTHVNMRLRHRYDMEIDFDEYKQLCERVKNKEYTNPRTLSTGEIEAWIQLKGQWVCFCYKPREGLVATVLPCAKYMQELVDTQVKNELKQKARNKLEDLREVAAYVAKEFAEQGQVDKAMNLLEAVSSLSSGGRNEIRLPGVRKAS